jgi:hypothetical protein
LHGPRLLGISWHFWRWNTRWWNITRLQIWPRHIIVRQNSAGQFCGRQICRWQIWRSNAQNWGFIIIVFATVYLWNMSWCRQICCRHINRRQISLLVVEHMGISCWTSTVGIRKPWWINLALWRL